MRPNVSTAWLHDRRAALHRRDRLRVGGGPAAGGVDLGDDLVGDLARRLVAVHAHAVVVDDDRRALGRAGERDRPPDAAPGSGYRDHLAVERTHVCLRSVLLEPRAGGTVSGVAVVSMKPAGIHHVSICVADADAGLAFYRDVLGLTQLHGPTSAPATGSTPAASRCT